MDPGLWGNFSAFSEPAFSLPIEWLCIPQKITVRTNVKCLGECNCLVIECAFSIRVVCLLFKFVPFWYSIVSSHLILTLIFLMTGEVGHLFIYLQVTCVPCYVDFFFRYSASVSIDCLNDIAKRAFINAYSFFIKEILFLKILAMPHSLQGPSSLTKVKPRPPALEAESSNHWTTWGFSKREECILNASPL